MPKIAGIVAVFLLFFAASVAKTAERGASPRGDGTIALYTYHEREFAEIVFRRDGKLDPAALKRIARAMRSRDGKTHPIDIRLIDLIDHLQDHFEAETVEIISGYRSPKYNRALRMSGRGAASESLHTKGVAADIHLDEVREEAVAAYARKLGAGGVGLYPRYAFVHVDVGPVRNWDEPAPKRRVLVGTKNNPNPVWRMTTNKNLYERGEELSLAIINEAYERQRLRKRLYIQRFRRGEWQEPDELAKGGRRFALGAGESTAFSWTIPDDQPYGKYRLILRTGTKECPPAFSNEFYVKRPIEDVR